MELDKASTWFKANKLTLNVEKTKFMIFSDKVIDSVALGQNLKIGNQLIEQIGSKCKVKYFKFVGHVLDENLAGKGILNIFQKNLLVQTLALTLPKISFPFTLENYCISVYLILI